MATQTAILKHWDLKTDFQMAIRKHWDLKTDFQMAIPMATQTVIRIYLKVVM